MQVKFGQTPQMAISAPAIQMKKIVKRFSTVAGPVTVLKGIDADFHPGEFVGVVGKSGSGKSTLVNMLTGIDRPTSGDVEIGGTKVNELNESQMSRWRGLNLGIVFQFYQLLPVLSLLENTMLPMDIAGRIPPVERETRAMELLTLVGLADFAHKMPSAVSGGQQQAAAIARALANDPPLIVADEPTGNLDSRTAENIFEIFESLVQKGKTIIVVTHDPGLAKRTNRRVLLCDGEIVHPALADSFEFMNHQSLLRLTKAAREVEFVEGRLPCAQEDSVYLLHTADANGVEATRVFGVKSVLEKGTPAPAALQGDGIALCLQGAAVREVVGLHPAYRAQLLGLEAMSDPAAARARK